MQSRTRCARRSDESPWPRLRFRLCGWKPRKIRNRKLDKKEDETEPLCCGIPQVNLSVFRDLDISIPAMDVVDSWVCVVLVASYCETGEGRNCIHMFGVGAWFYRGRVWTYWWSTHSGVVDCRVRLILLWERRWRDGDGYVPCRRWQCWFGVVACRCGLYRLGSVGSVDRGRKTVNDGDRWRIVVGTGSEDIAVLAIILRSLCNIDTYNDRYCHTACLGRRHTAVHLQHIRSHLSNATSKLSTEYKDNADTSVLFFCNDPCNINWAIY